MRKGSCELWAHIVIYSNANHQSVLHCSGAFYSPLNKAAKGLGQRRYLQVLDLVQQTLQGHVLVTGVLLPDGVLEALQVGFRGLGLFKKLLRMTVIECQ